MKHSLIYTLFILLPFLFHAGCKSKEKTTKTESPKKEVVKIPTLEERLKGMKKMSTAELGDYQVTIDGEELPVYISSGKQLKGMPLVNYMRENEFTYEVFGDVSTREPKAIVLRTQEEVEIKNEEEKEIPLPPGMATKLEYAPAFSGKDLKGTEWSLEKLKGKIAVLNFWFVTCAPCKEEIPELNALKKKYANNKNVEFIAFTFNDEHQVKEFTKTIPFDYHIIPNANQIIEDYIILGFPANIVLDQNNDILYQSIGYRHQIDKIMDRKIEEALRK